MLIKMKISTQILIGIFCLVLFLVGYGSGYLQKSANIRDGLGIEFNCNAYTTRDLQREGCQANITIPDKNVTIIMNSDYDSIKIMGSE